MTGLKRLLVGACWLPALALVGADVAFAAGAFAFGQKPGPTGWSSGSAYNYKTPEDAANSAMSRCRSRSEAGSYCKIIATINGRCFAIAVQDSSNGYGWNTASSVEEAQRLAMNRCTGYGKSCSIRDSFCDTINRATATPPAAAPAPAPVSPSAPSPGGGGSPACQKFPDLC